MKIGILGSGIVGTTLATAFLKEGHDVMLGTRSISKPEVIDWLTKNPTGKAGLFNQAASFGEIIVLAVKGSIAATVIASADSNNLEGKTIIDATNPIEDSLPPVNGVLQFFTPQNTSLMEALQANVPLANFVKAFSCVGNGLMYKPQLKETPTMFIAGNNDAAKATVTSILTSFGWETADMGKAEAARAIEPLCILWCIPGFINNQWYHAFKLLK